MQVTHTPADPPNSGSSVLAIIGWMANRSAPPEATAADPGSCRMFIK